MAYGYDDYLGYGDGFDYEDEEEAIVLDRLRRRRSEQQQIALNEMSQQPIQPQADMFQGGSPQLESPQQGSVPVSTKPQFDETRSLEQYLAETPEGQRRFTNIPGYGEDTFLMKERPLEPPAALGVSNEVRNQAPYGVDPYKETQRIAAELQAQGQEPDIEKIYTDVIDDLNRQDENIQENLNFKKAILAKHGPQKAAENKTLTALLENADKIIGFLGGTPEAQRMWQGMVDRAMGIKTPGPPKPPTVADIVNTDKPTKEKARAEKIVKDLVSKIPGKKEKAQGFDAYNTAFLEGDELPYQSFMEWLKLQNAKRGSGLNAFSGYGLGNVTDSIKVPR